MKFSVISKQKKQVILLYCSTLLSVLFGVLSSIVNTRFLDPSQYGDVRYVQNIINFIASLLLFGYFLSGSRLLALSDNNERSRRIRGALIVILSVAGFILLCTTAISSLFFLNKPSVSTLFLVSVPVCLFPLLSNYVNTTAQGDNHIGKLATARLLPALIYVPIAYIVYRFFGATSSKMMLLQWGTYTIILIFVIISTKPSFKNLKSIFHELNEENKAYGFQLYLGSLVMVSTGYLAGIFIGHFNSDNSEVGFYTLALTVTSPLSMLPSIIGTTYFKQFAKEPKIPSKVMKASIFITFASCLLFILLIKPLVLFLYSAKYETVGTYASLLAIGFCVHGLGDMINRYLGSHGQGKCIRNSSIANGCLKLFGYSFFVYLWNTNGAIITTILCDFLYAVVLYYYYIRFIKTNVRLEI